MDSAVAPILAALRVFAKAVLVLISLGLAVLVLSLALAPAPARGEQLVALYVGDRPRWRAAMSSALAYWFRDSRFDLDGFADFVQVPRTTMRAWHRTEPELFQEWEERE